MREFEFIDVLLDELGDATTNQRVRVGPGDDCAVTLIPRGHHLASSIDTLVADVHFPAGGDPGLIGYRALMVALSDLAAMGAAPAFAMLALTREQLDEDWVRRFARGVRAAAQPTGVAIAGGNLAHGPMNISVSVHGFVPIGGALLRSGARPGDRIYVTGPLGGAASALRSLDMQRYRFGELLEPMAAAYWQPRARIELGKSLRGIATAAIDVSDGLLQDLAHLCRASRVGASLDSADIPLLDGAGLQEALMGGDDYELCFTADSVPGAWSDGVFCIGEITSGRDLLLDGKPVSADGYQHFD